MRMFNPPHPGTVLRDYLGSVSVTTAARHLGNHARRAFAHPEWKRWDLGGDGLAPLRCSRYKSRTVDRDASSV